MKKLLFCLVMATVLFTSCSEDKKEVEGPKDENTLSGDITGSKTLDASVEYLLNGTLRVKDGGELVIPAGTVIKAQKGFSSYVLVEMGGKIMAQGTAELPITFTSSEAEPKAADWGGIIINGKAPISGDTEGTQGSTEVDNNYKYGGTDKADNSGILEYVTIAYTGARSSANVEHNGLTLNGVGNGTKIENIYIPEGADDGVEFFGGTVNVTNLLVVNSDDDMFDFTQGYMGTLENAYGVWEPGYVSTEKDPRGVEADGNMDGDFPTHVGQSDFTIKNLTIVNNSDYEMEDGIKIRRGAKATIINALLKGGKAKDLIDLTDSKTDAESATSISYNVMDVTLSGEEVKHPEAGEATVTKEAGNTGCDTSLFTWTGYDFK